MRQLPKIKHRKHKEWEWLEYDDDVLDRFDQVCTISLNI